MQIFENPTELNRFDFQMKKYTFCRRKGLVRCNQPLRKQAIKPNLFWNSMQNWHLKDYKSMQIAHKKTI